MIDLLDKVFVFSRGRSVSLAKRYPHVLGKPVETVEILAAQRGGEFVSAVVARSFTVVDGARRWQGRMIGFVATIPHARGQGYASDLLRRALASAAEAGADFAVLWAAANQELYRRLGWVEADVGMLGEVAVEGRQGAEQCEALDGGAIDWIEAVRSEYVARRVLREPSDYRVVPAPADQVALFRSRTSRHRAYAVVGRAERLTVVYELIGDPEGFDSIWRSLSNHAGRILVNDARRSSSAVWLDWSTPVRWKRQRNSMWWPFSASAKATDFESWHIPILDRI